MHPETQELLHAAEDAVNRLLERCGKAGPLYRGSPRAVAQVSRTGKWLLNALAALRNALPASAEHQPQQ